MKVELNRKDIISLIKGTSVIYGQFNNHLVIKAGHSYSDQYGRTEWSNLDNLTEDELWELYTICKII